MGIFGSNQSKKDSFAAISDMGNAPLTAFAKAEIRFHEIYGSSKVEASRWFVFAVGSLVVIFMMAVAFYHFLPLKTAVPYMVTLNRETGAVAQTVEASKFQPDESVKSYFLSKWIEKMRTIDPYQTQKNIKEAYALTRDKAVQEFTEYLNEEKPIERLVKDSTLTRTVKFISINPGVEQNIAFIRVAEEERTGANKVTTNRYMFTIHYAMTPPKDGEELRKNPIGIYVTHFVKSEEIGN
ncbi:VirB8/TrbF family protein [Undibacterium arcticum]|uniref:VirB8/TrbF family protein n=1 Tax=Undibacterium arcticum TaxID=1762892 RepID=A0ABV7F925_9BURK